MTVEYRTILAVGAAFVVAVLGWFAGGWVVSWLGVGELDLPARVGGVFFALSFANAALPRLVRRESHIRYEEQEND
jgi:hypothetical protein